jgi:hypothetical protein
MTIAVGAAHDPEPPRQQQQSPPQPQQQQQQQQEQQQRERQPALPRFRAGANLVRVDAYVTAAGKPVADLTVDDFEVLEDGRPQRLESFQVIRPRGPASQSERLEPNTVAQSRAMAADPNARLFVLFMDIWHTRIEGS